MSFSFHICIPFICKYQSRPCCCSSLRIRWEAAECASHFSVYQLGRQRRKSFQQLFQNVRHGWVFARYAHAHTHTEACCGDPPPILRHDQTQAQFSCIRYVSVAQDEPHLLWVMTSGSFCSWLMLYSERSNWENNRLDAKCAVTLLLHQEQTLEKQQ